MTTTPKIWQYHIQPLSRVDWRKTVGVKLNPLWDNVCIVAGSVVSDRQARIATQAVLKDVLNCPFRLRRSRY